MNISRYAGPAILTLLTFTGPAMTQTQQTPDDPIRRPFGPGQRVEVQCDKPDGYLFVAQGVVDDRPSFPDPFVKLGRIPVQLELPSGIYTVLVEGESFPSQSIAFEVRSEPVHVRVKTGSDDLRMLATLLIAAGSAALIGGAAIEISGTQREDSPIKRKISIPLFIGGGVGFVGGLSVYFASGTSIDHTGFRPQTVASQSADLVRGFSFTTQF